MSKQQSNFQNYILPRHSIVLLLIFCFLTGVSSHLIIFFHQLDSGIRVLHSLLMGLCYDLDDCFFNYFFCCHFPVFCKRKIWTTHNYFHFHYIFFHIIYWYKLLFRFWYPPAISYQRVSDRIRILFDQHPGGCWELYFHDYFFYSQHNIHFLDMEFLQR